MALVMQYPSSPLASPVIPGSSVMAASLPGRPNERNFCLPLGSNRITSMGAYSGWQSQRGNEKLDDMRCSSVLEELKNSKTLMGLEMYGEAVYQKCYFLYVNCKFTSSILNGVILSSSVLDA